MSMSAMKWVYDLRADTELKGPRKAVLAALAFHADKAGKCWPKQITLAKECGLNKDTVTKALAWLEGNDYLSRERQHRADGFRRNDLYTVNLVRPDRTRKEEDLIRSQRSPSPATPMSVSSDAEPTTVDQPTSEPTSSSGTSYPSSTPYLAGSTDVPNYNGGKGTHAVGRASDPLPQFADEENDSVEQLPPSLLAVVRQYRSDISDDAMRAWKQQRPGDLSPKALGEVRRYCELRVGAIGSLPKKHGHAMAEAFPPVAIAA